jgi:hypothetical protein
MGLRFCCPQRAPASALGSRAAHPFGASRLQRPSKPFAKHRPASARQCSKAVAKTCLLEAFVAVKEAIEQQWFDLGDLEGKVSVVIYPATRSSLPTTKM